MTTKEACTVLNCDERTVRRMLVEGRLNGKRERKGRQISWNIDPDSVRSMVAKDKPPASPVEFEILKAIKSAKKTTFSDICNLVDKGPETVQAAIDKLREDGYEITVSHDRIELSTPEPRSGELHIHQTPSAGEEIIFGALGDTHLGSKWERLDVLHTLYKDYQESGITDVYHTGNMVEGDARFNKFDVKVYGIEAQTDYFLEHYPRVEGVTTYYITGDDHEGWWMQREGINYGKYLQNKAIECGRDDLVFIGHVEADVVFESPDGNAMNHRHMRVMHPGGGSSYAVSYKPQKIAECVPLESEILTCSGWKTYDQLIPGEEVLGYNIETDQCEWTTCEKINVYDDVEIVKYANKQWSVECTRNHKWALERESRGGPNPDSRVPTQYSKVHTPYLGSIDESKDRTRLIQAAKAVDGHGFELTRDNNLKREDAVAHVLKMTSEQRQAFIQGMMFGEGTRAVNTNSYSLVFSQRPGEVMDAFRLACFMEGIATSHVALTTKKISGEDKVCGRTTLLSKRKRIVTNKFLEQGTRIGKVWCPTTKLGTWVMRQGDTITITGNSFSGGEKPHICLIGHYHKFDVCYPREVWCVQTGCVQDQSLFMRKRQLQSHVGGCKIRMRQLEDGRIVSFAAEFMPFYDTGYYARGGKGLWTPKL